MALPSAVSLLDNVLLRLRAHGYMAAKIEIPGKLVLDLVTAPPDPLSPMEQRVVKARDDRTARILGIPTDSGDDNG